MYFYLAKTSKTLQTTLRFKMNEAKTKTKEKEGRIITLTIDNSDIKKLNANSLESINRSLHL